MNPQFWHGKRVLLTGHTGFKGGWMSLWLQSMGAKLVGYALNPPTKPNLFEAANIADGMVSVIGDIRDLQNLLLVIQDHKPEIIFHMAAQPLVRYSYEEPVDTYATNVMGTVNLLEAVRLSSGVKAVVNITTDKCYENKEWEWAYRETEPMGGYDPYSSSKGCAELVTASYRNSFFNPKTYEKHGVGIATVRAGNVIGGGDWAKDRLIPDIVNAFEQGKVVNIRNPHSIRPWQHVMEPLGGYLILAELLFNKGANFADAWNFGPNEQDAKSVSWIVSKMAHLWDGDVAWKVDDRDHPHEANYLKLDISKARKHLNWQPKLNLQEALELIVDWSKQRQAGVDIRKLTLEQIEKYQNILNKL